eukprot:SAG25_NODE_679_length_5963_cov_10.036835_7_plen_66_part_00
MSQSAPLRGLSNDVWVEGVYGSSWSARLPELYSARNRNGGINGYFTFEHGLLQGEPSIIRSKWGF